MLWHSLRLDTYRRHRAGYSGGLRELRPATWVAVCVVRFTATMRGHSKVANPIERYLATMFCYGCQLGPTATATSLGTIDRRQIA